MAGKKTMGKDAVVWCLSRFLHPSAAIRAKYVNPVQGHTLSGMIVRRQEPKIVNRKEVTAIVCVHDDFKENGEHIELYALPRYIHISQEGPPELFFNVVQQPSNESAQESVSTVINDEVRGALHGAPTDEEVNLVRFSGITVDDDNEPAPENRPSAADTQADRVFGDWDHYTGICPRRSASAHNTQPRLKNFPRDVKPTRLQLFELLFPKTFVLDVILVAINASLNGPSVSYGEFLQFLGIWLIMGCVQGFSRTDFWSSSPITGLPEHTGAPYRFNHIMSRYRFDQILSNLRFTMDDPPAYKDPFWEIRQLIDAWNENMDEEFIAGWLSCLDESISVWTNEFTCPGFMFVPRKPHPFGNEYHTVCCCLCGVLYRLELMEGKDAPPERPAEQFSELGKTVGLLLRMTRSIWGTGKALVLDSGFCVLKGIVELKKKGVYAAAQIKKRRYWPKHVDGDAIKSYFEDKDVGSVAALPGNLDGVPVWIHCMKEPDYVTMLMSSYGTLESMGQERPRQWRENGETKKTKFRYPEIVYLHYQNRHYIDDHNNRRHKPISLEEAWGTKRWPNRVFAFLLAVTEGNAYLLNKRYNAETAEDNVLHFRRSLAMEMINNPYVKKEEPLSATKAKRRRTVAHELCTLPRGKQFHGERMVNAKSDYPQRTCVSCKKKIRTFCACSPGVYRCNGCFTEHVLSCETKE